MNKKPNTKVCLLGASFATNNMGVGALAAGAIKCILHSYPGAEISLLDYGKESLQYDVSVNGRSVRVRLLNTRFSKKFYLKNNIARLLLVALLAKVIPFRNMRRRIIAKNEYLDYLSQADIVAAISGGDSFSDIYGLRRLLYIALPQLLILFLGKELFLLPQTVGPFESRIAKRIAKYILQHASVTYTRDLVEQKMLKQSFDLNGRLRFCYDIGFALDPVAPAKMDVGDLL
ncbi:MAG: polysaccharide pyruvyl transferase family protein, partial [bacterium]